MTKIELDKIRLLELTIKEIENNTPGMCNSLRNALKILIQDLPEDIQQRIQTKYNHASKLFSLIHKDFNRNFCIIQLVPPSPVKGQYYTKNLWYRPTDKESRLKILRYFLHNSTLKPTLTLQI